MEYNLKHCKVLKVEQLEDRPVGDGSGGPITPGYEILGFLFSDPAVGKPLEMFRYKRNNVEAIGNFRTSPLKEVLKESNGWTVKTQNSIYKIDLLKEA